MGIPGQLRQDIRVLSVETVETGFAFLCPYLYSSLATSMGGAVVVVAKAP